MIDLKNKCIILLSTKSAGSSALQNLITQLPNICHVLHTEHRENETLYWTKAASILGLPQYDMLDSEVPLKPDKAKYQLIQFLQRNLDCHDPPRNDNKLIFNGWKMLCERYAPVFFEKSPHHLHQWRALQLINDCIERYPTIEFLVVGLIRNPMDTIYSRWTGGRSYPEKYQFEWLRAYRNLLEFRKIVRCGMTIIRYEDMVRDPACLKDLYRFAGYPQPPVDEGYLHRQSIAKWKKDQHYGFRIADEVMALAEEFGYDRADMINTSKPTWFARKYLLKTASRVMKPYRRLRGRLRKMLLTRA